MLRWRLLLGAILIAAFATISWQDARSEMPGIWFAPLVLLVTVLGSREVLWLLNSRDLRPRPWVVYLGNVLLISIAFASQWWGQTIFSRAEPMVFVLLTFATTILLAFLAEMRHYEKPGTAMLNVALALFGIAYVGLLMSVVVGLRFIEPGNAGVVPVLILVVVVKLADIGAYTVGRLIGKHKMAPVLSPGKTWEGAAGAFGFGVLAALFVMHVLYPAFDSSAAIPGFGNTAVLGLTIAAAGMVGDLAESLFKRDMGRKDSSDWMPGFGGVLDIVDSMLLAAPVAYLGWLLLV